MLDEHFLFSSGVQGRESCSCFQVVDGCSFQPPSDESHTCILHSGQSVGVAMCSSGPSCGSILHHWVDVAHVHLFEDLVVGSPFGACELFHKKTFVL